MVIHGFSLEEVIGYLNRKRHDDSDDYFRWFTDVWPRAAQLYAKPGAGAGG